MSQETVSYYEDFSEIEKKIWFLLTDAVKNRSSEFRTPVFICGNDKDLDGRVVVLRKADQENSRKTGTGHQCSCGRIARPHRRAGTIQAGRDREQHQRD